MKPVLLEYFTSPGVTDEGKRIPSPFEEHGAAELSNLLFLGRDKSRWLRFVGYIKSRVAQMCYKIKRGQNMKGLDYYRALAVGASHTIDLNQDEESVVLKAHDYGVAALNEEEVQLLHSVIGKLKGSIWP